MKVKVENMTPVTIMEKKGNFDADDNIWMKDRKDRGYLLVDIFCNWRLSINVIETKRFPLIHMKEEY